MTTPVRIQRKRTRGFDLQAASRAVNGLECVYVGRPTKWGNPFAAGPWVSKQQAVDAFNAFLEAEDESFDPMCAYQGMKDQRDAILAGIGDLRGKNLACWCRTDRPCHADVLLEIANRPVCEAAE